MLWHVEETNRLHPLPLRHLRLPEEVEADEQLLHPLPLRQQRLPQETKGVNLKEASASFYFQLFNKAIMNVFKYDRIVVGNYVLVEGKVLFSISYDANVQTKEIAIPDFLDEIIFYENYRLALCVASYSYALVAREVVVDIPISDAQYDFLERIKPSFYSNLRVFLGNIMMAPSCLGVVKFKFDATFRQSVIVPIISNTATLLYSGGKESLLSSIILDEAGINYSKVLINSGLYPEEYSESLANFKDTNVIESCRAFLFDDSVITEGTWDNPCFAFERLIFAVIDMISNRRNYLCVGNEYETTALDFNNFGGSTSYGRSWQQSNFALKEIQRYLHFIGYYGEVFSPVQNMETIFEESALAFLYPDRFDEQCSCIMTYFEDGKLRPCLSCIKCKILNAIVTGFNKLNLRSGLPLIESIYYTNPDVKTIKSTPVHYPEHFLDDEQLRQIEKLCAGDFEDSWFKLIFDELHSEEFLPASVCRVVKNMESLIKDRIELWKK